MSSLQRETDTTPAIARRGGRASSNSLNRNQNRNQSQSQSLNQAPSRPLNLQSRRPTLPK